MAASEKSAEAVVAWAAKRRAEREGRLEAVILGRASHQKLGQPGRTAGGAGEPRVSTGRDEARPAGHEHEGMGRGDLLTQVLSRENMAEAWKRVKTNK